MLAEIFSKFKKTLGLNFSIIYKEKNRNNWGNNKENTFLNNLAMFSSK